ncbi:hypothetical protein NMG60_11026988 [Bertholletia excelsa]
MRLFLGRRLSTLQWTAIILLAVYLLLRGFPIFSLIRDYTGRRFPFLVHHGKRLRGVFMQLSIFCTYPGVYVGALSVCFGRCLDRVLDEEQQ